MNKYSLLVLTLMICSNSLALFEIAIPITQGEQEVLIKNPSSEIQNFWLLKPGNSKHHRRDPLSIGCLWQSKN